MSESIVHQLGVFVKKVKAEIVAAFQQVMATLPRFLHLNDIKHAYFNLFTETLRALPYTLGHAIGVYVLYRAFMAWVWPHIGPIVMSVIHHIF